MRSFLRVLLLTGHHSLPEEYHYWSTPRGLRVPALEELICGTEFLKIAESRVFIFEIAESRVFIFEAFRLTHFKRIRQK